MSKKTKIDTTEFDAILKEVSADGENVIGNLTSEQMDRIHKANENINKQVIEIAKDTFSDAVDAEYEPHNEKKCYSIYDIKGTTIAYLWINADNTTNIVPNTEVYNIRVN